ncbi:MAG: riboflavin synthase subunit alpha [Rhodoferax sp.]|nr:riboflavin synthase subunit alpha [Rhodoferax sp.]
MFTGIVQGISTITSISDAEGLRTFTLKLPQGFGDGLSVGASVSVDGVCLTVTSILFPTLVEFDVVLQSLSVTTLGGYVVGSTVNTERAAKDGAEIGGHPLSGHIDFAAQIESVRTSQNNHVLRVQVPPDFRKYIFPKGYIAINGASLTISEVDRLAGWFEVWLIPETRRMTVFEQKQAGDWLNIEIERGTQVVVDTVRATMEETLGSLKPALEAFLAQRGVMLEDFIAPLSLPR